MTTPKRHVSKTNLAEDSEEDSDGFGSAKMQPKTPRKTPIKKKAAVSEGSESPDKIQPDVGERSSSEEPLAVEYYRAKGMEAQEGDQAE